MPADSKWLGDVLAGVAFFLGLTCYAIRMIPPTFPREPPETPVKWDKAGPIIGIDLGTTYARVGLVVSEHRVQIFRDHDSLPAGYFNNAASPASSACQFKYLPLSTNFEVNVVTDYLVGPEDSPARRLALPATFTSYSEDCSSLHKMAASLHKLRVTAENFYGSAISQAVIAIPNAYTEDQRGTIKDMAVLAGLSPVRLIDQSVVIAMAYGLDRRRGESYALVLDVGSTARATLLHVDNGDLRVLSHSQNLGGSAFNQLLFDYAMDAHGDKMNENLTTVQKLILEDQVEMAKIKLSVEDYAAIALPMEDPPWFIVSLAAAEFNKIVESLVEDIVAGTTNEVLSTVQVSPNAVDHVILAGGSAYIPALKDRFARQFPSTVPLSTGESYPDDAVVYGASLFARRLALDKVPDDSKIYVQNATPMRFGVEVVGGLFATVIPRNSPLPATFTRRLNLHSKTLRIFTGSGEYTNITEVVGSVPLLPCMSLARVKVTFDLNIYGVLNVTAMDSMGCSHSMLVEPRRPSHLEIAHMEAEAAAVAERKDVLQRMERFRTYVAHYIPQLSRQLEALGPDHPQRVMREQIMQSLTDLDAWMAKRMGSASRAQFVEKLSELEELLERSIGLL